MKNLLQSFILKKFNVDWLKKMKSRQSLVRCATFTRLTKISSPFFKQNSANQQIFFCIIHPYFLFWSEKTRNKRTRIQVLVQQLTGEVARKVIRIRNRK